MISVTAHERAEILAMGRYFVRRATVEEFQESRVPWNHLVSSMRFASPFCTWEWIFTWWEHFGTKLELIPLFIHDGNELRGILPLFRDGVSAAGKLLNGARLDYCGSTEVCPDHLDIICAPEDAELCVAAVIDFLGTRLPRWASIRLPMLAQDSDLLRTLGPVSGKLQIAVRQVSIAPYIALTGSFEDYLARLRSNERYKLKSRRKKMFEGGKIRYTVFKPAEFEKALQILFDLHTRRAEVKGIASTFGRSSVYEFHRALLQRLDPSNVMLRCLNSEAGVVAAFYGFRYDGRVFFYQIGYDPDWSWASPGFVILSESIREAFAAGCTEYNFLQGDEPYKYAFTHEARALFDCRIYNNTLSGWMVRKVFTLRERLKTLVHGNIKIQQQPSPHETH